MIHSTAKAVRSDLRLISGFDTLWTLEIGLGFAQNLISTQLSHNQKLVRRICANMFDTLAEHREGHRIREKQQLNKETALFLRVIPSTPFYVSHAIDS